ncbi:MAG: sn-glycerol-1-phosphate dehydrogenase, partial [Mesorhizobium sp.]
ETGKKAVVPYDRIVIEESLDGRAADLVSELGLGERFTVVADAATYDALGERVARELKTLGPVDVLILDHPHADMANVESLAVKLADAD